jgi:LysR family transcriptional activator of nhaA
MDVDKLNFRHLFYFWHVAKEGNLTRSAARLHTSQSALSAQIRQLEDRLGEPLFYRQGRRLELTDIGHLVLDYADGIFGMSREMLMRLQGRSEGVARLRVGSVATLSRNFQKNWLLPALAAPDILLTLESGPFDWLLERLRHHKLDVVLANEAVPTDPDQPLRCRFLGSQPVSLVGHANGWQGRSLRIPQDLDGVAIALPGPSNVLRAQFDALCESSGVKPRLRAEVDDMAMLRLIARESDWLTLMPDVVVQDELRDGTLVVVGRSSQLRERFFAITAPYRGKLSLLEQLLAASGEES